MPRICSVFLAILCTSVGLAAQTPEWERMRVEARASFQLGRYAAAEALFGGVLATREHEGTHDAALVPHLYDLAGIYLAQMKLSEAERVSRRALRF